MKYRDIREKIRSAFDSKNINKNLLLSSLMDYYEYMYDEEIPEEILDNIQFDDNINPQNAFNVIKDKVSEIRNDCDKLRSENNKSGIKFSSGKYKSDIGAVAAGITYGNVSNASTNYGMDKFNTPKGHGFAAERANHIYDKLTGKDAKIVGDDNAKWGADRVVDNVNIQSKYCNSGSKCIQECFKDGKMKYINADGTPMQIEVPSDKYEDAVKAMEGRIRKGEVPGVTDTNKAKDIVRKGHFTYEQAKNIAKAGTIESLTFDAVNSAIVAKDVFGITATISFAINLWNGEEFDVAIKNAAYSGLKVGGISFASGILTSQITKMGMNSALVGSTDAIVNIMGPKASQLLVNAFRSGKNIYGAAAMKSASKMLRGNFISGIASFAIMSSVDFVDIFRGRISGEQLVKNLADTASSVAGGGAGWIAGAAVGSVAGPIGMIVGGFLGAFAGGTAASKASKYVTEEVLLMEDDADYLYRIIEDTFTKQAENFLLNKEEGERAVEKLKNKLTGSKLKDMYSASNHEKFAEKMIISIMEEEVQKRKKIKAITVEDMSKGLRTALEEISDNQELAIN